MDIDVTPPTDVEKVKFATCNSEDPTEEVVGRDRKEENKRIGNASKKVIKHALRQQAKRRRKNTTIASTASSSSSSSTSTNVPRIIVKPLPPPRPEEGVPVPIVKTPTMKEVLASIPGFSIKPRKRTNKKLSTAAQLEQTKEGCIDLETPDSILVNTNLRALLNKYTFTILPTLYQHKLVQLLPSVDRQIVSNSLNENVRLNASSLNNEFFARACLEWQERLAEGEFTPENQQKLKSEADRERSKLDPWKLKHFEPIWGDRNQTEGENTSSQRTQNNRPPIKTTIKLRNSTLASKQKPAPVVRRIRTVGAVTRSCTNYKEVMQQQQREVHGTIRTPIPDLLPIRTHKTHKPELVITPIQSREIETGPTNEVDPLQITDVTCASIETPINIPEITIINISDAIINRNEETIISCVSKAEKRKSESPLHDNISRKRKIHNSLTIESINPLPVSKDEVKINQDNHLCTARSEESAQLPIRTEFELGRSTKDVVHVTETLKLLTDTYDTSLDHCLPDTQEFSGISDDTTDSCSEHIVERLSDCVSEAKGQNLDDIPLPFDGQDRLSELNDQYSEITDQMSETEQLSETNEHFLEANDQSSDTNDRSLEANDHLSETNDQLSENNDQLSETNEQLLETNDHLSEASDRLSEVNDRLLETTDKLLESNETVDRLSQTNDQTSEMNDQISEVNDQASETNDQLSETNDNLMANDRLSETMDQMSETTENNDRLSEANDRSPETNDHLSEVQETMSETNFDIQSQGTRSETQESLEISEEYGVKPENSNVDISIRHSDMVPEQSRLFQESINIAANNLMSFSLNSNDTQHEEIKILDDKPNFVSLEVQGAIQMDQNELNEQFLPNSLILQQESLVLDKNCGDSCVSDMCMEESAEKLEASVEESDLVLSQLESNFEHVRNMCDEDVAIEDRFIDAENYVLESGQISVSTSEKCQKDNDMQATLFTVSRGKQPL